MFDILHADSVNTCRVLVARNRLCAVLPSGSLILRVQILSEESAAGSPGTILAMLCLMA